MIDVAIVDITKLKSALACGEIDPARDEELSHLYSDKVINTGGRNTDTLYTRLCAYRALECFYRLLLNEKMPSIVRDKFGKPELFFDGKNESAIPIFNLSHSEELVAIAFYKNRGQNESALSRLGVDIQYHKKLENKAALEAKMPKNANNSLQNTQNEEVLLHFFELSETQKILKTNVGFNATALNLERGDKDCFFDKWTRVEAVMKADGRGFRAFCEADVLLNFYNVLSYKFSYKTREFSLSLAYL